MLQTPAHVLHRGLGAEVRHQQRSCLRAWREASTAHWETAHRGEGACFSKRRSAWRLPTVTKELGLPARASHRDEVRGWSLHKGDGRYLRR